jgi:hypothetical protein
MFQPTFDTTTEEHLGWDEFGYSDILVTMDAAPQQANEVGASQLTQPPPVWTQSSQLTPAAGGATTAGGATPVGGGATPPVGGCCRLIAGGHGDTVSRPARTASGHLTPGRKTGTRPGLVLELLGGRGAGAFRCTTFTMILYKLLPFTH